MVSTIVGLLRTYPKAFLAGSGATGVITMLFVASLYFGNRVAPNVQVLDTPIGGLAYDTAETTLSNIWRNSITINVVVAGQTTEASPLDMGIRLDAVQTVQLARDAGFGSIVFGYELAPVLSLDSTRAQAYFATLAETINILPKNARYALQGNQVIGVPGQPGQAMDIDLAVRNLSAALNVTVTRRTFEPPLMMMLPDVNDPANHLELAQRFVNESFQIVGYDPFTNTFNQWTTTPEQLVTWLEADTSQLRVRFDSAAAFVEAINEQLAARGQFIDTQDAARAINASLAAGTMSARVRIRHYPATYEVVAGDTAYRISRKTGIPFFLIEEANRDVELNTLSPGDILNLPSQDVTLPLEPVANKRIIVNLKTQSLVAYENGQEAFRWQISSGISSAPTSPGIYQILSHEPVAYGSSYTLCGDAGCGQWELNWFMGLYEVVPGLVNGFHGAVLLPNGSYLGGNQVGTPYTLGCVMSREDQARLLYDWADEGTIVEIISNEFEPRSQLAVEFAQTG